MVQCGGAHYPQILGTQGVAGDGLGPRDQVLEIKNSNRSVLLDFYAT
jgi:hypothetical protein